MNIDTGTTDHQNKYTPYNWGNEILRRKIAWKYLMENSIYKDILLSFKIQTGRLIEDCKRTTACSLLVSILSYVW